MNMKAPIAALLVTLLAVSVAPTPARAQTELERLGGGPGGVPQQNPRFGFFNERAGNKLRTRSKRATAPSTAPASPSPAAEEEAAQEPPDIEWKGGLISVSCDDTHIGDFLLEFNREFTTKLKDLGIRHEYEETAGAHTWGVWRAYWADFMPKLFRETPSGPASARGNGPTKG